MKRSASIFITLAVMLTWLAGCNPENGEGERIPLSFSTSVEGTRAGRELTESSMESMGVFAYLTNGSFTTAATPNYMCNQKVEKTGGAWTYSPQMYWPAYTENKVSFFAYAPHSDEIIANSDAISVPATHATGYPKLIYTNTTGQTDLLAALPQTDRTAANGQVKLAFKHAMTKVIFKVKGGNTYAKEIVNFTLAASKQATLTYYDSGSTWSGFTGTETYTVAANQTIGITDTDKTVGTLLMLPAGTPSTTKFSLSFKVKTTGGTDLITKTVVNQTLPAIPTWDMEGAVTYTLDLSEEGVAVTASSNIDWELGKEENIQL